jgi:GNAT superfamily N-acetyltransferase
MNEIRISPLDPHELAPLTELFELQMREHGVKSSRDILRAALIVLRTQPEQGFVLSATCDHSMVGVAYAARILSLEHGGWSGWLEELFILPQWRGRGAGSQLLAAVIAGAAERGWAALDLEVDANHQRVIPLYTRHLFEPVNRTRFVRRLRAPPAA